MASLCEQPGRHTLMQPRLVVSAFARGYPDRLTRYGDDG